MVDAWGGSWGHTAFGNDSYTKILLLFNGTDASTSIIDDNIGGAAHTWTAAGNAQIDTAVKKFGTGALLLDGTGDWVTTGDHADFTLGSGEWTVDCWFNCTGATGTTLFFAGQGDSGATGTTISLALARNASDHILVQAFVSSTSFAVEGNTQFNDATNTGWHHFAFVRTGDTLKLFIDGTQEGGDVAISGSINDSSNAFRVGALGELTTNTWIGSLDVFRLSVGVARWTSNFTPPVFEYEFAGRMIQINNPSLVA